MMEKWPVLLIFVLYEHEFESEHEQKETILECNSCDNTCTQKDTLLMHTDVKHKAKLSKGELLFSSFGIVKLIHGH